MIGNCCYDCLNYEYHEFDDGDYIRICKHHDDTKKLENNPFDDYIKWNCPYFEEI